MMDFMEIIKGRRSIRKYEDKDVSEDILNKILESVQWAQSWANTQCWDIVVVKDPAVKEALQGTLAKGNPSTKAMTAAPVVLAVCGKKGSSGFYKDKEATKFGDWMLFDLGIATQNICLTACEQGLGTVVAGLFDHDKAAEILGLPDTHEVPVMIPLGHPAKISSAPKRKEISEFVHKEKFSA